MILREFIHSTIWVKRLLSGQLDVPEISTIRQFINPRDICLDVGAHAGSWTRPLSSIVPKGHVYAFEALPYYARVLRTTMRILCRRNVTVINQAVVDSNYQVRIIWKDGDGNLLTGRTHIVGTEEKLVEPVLVDGTSLDSFVESADCNIGRIRFIKMDIEGAELLALQGAKKIIDKWQPLLYLEVNKFYCKRYGYTVEDLFCFLKNYGYKSFLISADSCLVEIDARDCTEQVDVLFCGDTVSEYYKTRVNALKPGNYA